MKLLVETTGSFLLVQVTTGKEVPYDRPSVVLADGWTNTQLGLGHLKVLANEIPDEQTDEEFLKWWKDCDGDKEMAVESYLSQFGGKLEEDHELKKSMKSPPKKEAKDNPPPPPPTVAVLKEGK